MHTFFSTFSEVSLMPFTWQMGLSLLLVVFLLLLSGYMSSSETAFFSLSSADLEILKESNSSRDGKLLSLLANSEQLLATILIGNNIVNIAIVLLSNYLFIELVDFGNALFLRFLLQTVLLTFLLLLFGEITPKVIARQNPLLISRFATPFMAVLYAFFTPLSKALMKTAKEKNKNKSGKKRGHKLSVDDLSKAVALTEGKSPVQSEIMEGVIKFHDKTAVEIMVPRIDMIDIDYNASFVEVLSMINGTGNSRIPVYKGTQDTICGLLYIKDCIPYIGATDTFDWHQLIRPAYFVPENKMLDELLEEFRAERIHMAIVVDEYGGTSGLVTLEDILEEIVGEIADEYDEEAFPYIQLKEGCYLFQAKTQITDFCRLMDIEDNYFEAVEQEVDTLGGVFLEIGQEIPRIGDKVSFRDLEMEITEMDKFRIQQMQITISKSLLQKLAQGKRNKKL